MRAEVAVDAQTQLGYMLINAAARITFLISLSMQVRFTVLLRHLFSKIVKSSNRQPFSQCSGLARGESLHPDELLHIHLPMLDFQQ